MVNETNSPSLISSIRGAPKVKRSGVFPVVEGGGTKGDEVELGAENKRGLGPGTLLVDFGAEEVCDDAWGAMLKPSEGVANGAGGVVKDLLDEKEVSGFKG